MKLQLISYFISGFMLFACNNQNKDAAGSEANKATETNASTNPAQSEENSYIIQPPDTNYTGEYLDKYPNGNTKFRGYFRFGKRHGEWMAFYADGTLWSRCFYKEGLKHGLNHVNFENGKTRYEGYFKNDMRDSIWVFYDAYGMEQRRVAFKNDEPLPAK